MSELRMPLCGLADGQKCSEADAKTTADCLGKNKVDMTITDKTKVCEAMNKMTACYPKCYCDDAANKADIDTAKKTMELFSCTFKCGTSSGLRASAFTVFIAAAVSMVAAR